MRPLLTALSALALLTLVTLAMLVPMLPLALLKLLLPGRRLRRLCSHGLMGCAETWGELTRRVYAALLPTVWDVRGGEALRRDTSYLLVCNHQSWVDIPALLVALNRKTPFFRFFVKRELVWLPLLGLAFWALDYPLMRRHTRTYLEKHPEKRGDDLRSTRRACERFRDIPVTIVNYLEGTRFTPAKQAQQSSPYRYLLRPKTGGVAFVLAALGGQLDALLDVTVVYPGRRIPGFWQLLSGQLPRVIVDIRSHALDPSLWQGDYQNDPEFRQHLQDWVSRLWAEKDARIARLRAELEERG